MLLASISSFPSLFWLVINVLFGTWYPSCLIDIQAWRMTIRCMIPVARQCPNTQRVTCQFPDHLFPFDHLAPGIRYCPFHHKHASKLPLELHHSHLSFCTVLLWLLSATMEQDLVGWNNSSLVWWVPGGEPSRDSITISLDHGIWSSNTWEASLVMQLLQISHVIWHNCCSIIMQQVEFAFQKALMASLKNAFSFSSLLPPSTTQVKA